MTPEECQDSCMALLDELEKYTVGLSPDDSVYTLNYIAEKLALVGAFQEQIGEQSIKLSRLQIFSKTSLEHARGKFRTKERLMKGSAEYIEEPRESKTNWLERQLLKEREELELWSSVFIVVSEVKEAIADRQNTLRRIDSDLRLHTSLLEQRVRQGSLPTPSLKGESGGGDIDLD